MAKSTTTTPSPRKRSTSKKPAAGAAEARKPNGSSAPTDVDPTEDDIRLRAYQRYLERGGEHGADFDDWLEAEKDLRSTRHN
jgi:Protein of unknown function (DUF2934)